MSETTIDKELAPAIQQMTALYKQLMEKLGQATPELKVIRVKASAKTKTSKRCIAPQLVHEFVEWFIKTPEDQLYNVKRGQWECKVGDSVSKTAHTLVFHSRITKNRVDAADVICIRPPGVKLAIFNASRIAYGTSYAAQKEPQAIAERCGAVPIPFQNVVAKDPKTGAGLDLTKLQLIEWGGSEKMVIPPIEKQRWGSVDFHVINRHFAGAVVISVGERYFLFDADREELQWCGFNPFFTQLPHAVSTIGEAYASLQPPEVTRAIAKRKKVIRQGELFFVPEDQDPLEKKFTPDAQSKFFYEQLCERIDLSGATTYNAWRYMQDEQVQKFLGLCKNNNRGKLPDSELVDADEATAKLRTLLENEVGPKEATYDPEDKEAMSGTVWGRGSHEIGYRYHLHGEVRARLRAESTYSKEGGRILKPTAGRFPFLYAATIGDSTNGTQRHSPTVMYCPEGMGSKNPTIYVRGTVFHLGREHRPVYLPGWHRVYPNTAVHNWTVSGDVD